MAEAFRLTMQEPRPRPPAPYQHRREDGAWTPLDASQLRYCLERYTAFPDVARFHLDAGGVVRLDRAPHPAYVRRTPTTAELDAARRQLALIPEVNP